MAACWWHHWHSHGPLRQVTLRASGRCTRPSEIIARREQCCRCEALRWREYDYGAPVSMPSYRDAAVLEVGAVYDASGLGVAREC